MAGPTHVGKTARYRQGVSMAWVLVQKLLARSSFLGLGLASVRLILRQISHVVSSNSRGRSDEGIPELEAVVINLRRRTERLESTLRELERIGIESIRRIDAVESENGALGCAMSHQIALNSLSSRPAIVCEDDIDFQCSREELDAVLREFFSSPWMDVLCLSYTGGTRGIKISKLLRLNVNLRTTACYVVKGTRRKPLIDDFRRGEYMLRSGVPTHLAAADVVWDSSQFFRLNFVSTTSPLVTQRPSYSDIEKRWVDYGKFFKQSP